NEATERRLRLFVAAFWRWQSARLEEALRLDLLRRIEGLEAWAETGRLPAEFRRSKSRNVVFFGEALSAAWTTTRGAILWKQNREIRRAVAKTLLTCLRDVFATPFRPVTVEPAWLTPTVTMLAQAAYDLRELPSGHLDQQRLTVL